MTTKTDKKKKDDVEKKESSEGLELPSSFLNTDQREIRTIGLFGDIDEDRSGDLMMALLLLTELSGKDPPYDPITMYISTYGGTADEMFGIYDVMSKIKSQCEICTIGVGKVMSAGTLILAAGTKGMRMIGKHCRVMIHSVNAGSAGDLHNIENEVKAIKQMQDLYINAMCNETHMTKRQIQKLIDRKINVYLTAEEAIEYGIADEIL